MHTKGYFIRARPIWVIWGLLVVVFGVTYLPLFGKDSRTTASGITSIFGEHSWILGTLLTLVGAWTIFTAWRRLILFRWQLPLLLTLGVWTGLWFSSAIVHPDQYWPSFARYGLFTAAVVLSLPRRPKRPQE